MISKTDDPKRHRGIYLLPNIFTVAALFAGFYAIVASMHGRFEPAAIAVFVAMVLDGLDGRVARLTHTESAFGAEFDSLSDMVSFGLAPALVMYQWALASMAELGRMPGKLGWLVAFSYAACAALRLARFNTQVGSADKRYFMGLPSPSAAAIVVGLVWVGSDLGMRGEDLLIPALFVTISTAALMVSRILFHSFKQWDLKGRVPFETILIVILVLVFIAVDTPKTLFIIFFAYGLSGPLLWLWRARQRSRRRVQGSPEPTQPSDDPDPS